MVEAEEFKYATVSEIVLSKKEKAKKDPYLRINKKALADANQFKYGRDAVIMLFNIIDYQRNPKNKDKVISWNKKFVRLYFKDWHLSDYQVDKMFDILINIGLLKHEVINPHPGCNRITHKYTFFSNSDLNQDYNKKETFEKLGISNAKKLKQKAVKKIATEDLLDSIKNNFDNPIEDKEINNNESPEFKNDEIKEHIIKAKNLYDDSVFNSGDNLYKIDSSSDLILDYKNVINNSNTDIINTTDFNELAKEGFNIIVKGIMKYKNSDIENNINHANNLVNIYSTYDSTKDSMDSLWKFRSYNRLFTKDFNRTLDDSSLIEVNGQDKFTQNEIKNMYFINFCFMLGSYLYYNNNVKSINSKLNGMLSYQDINAFTKVFEEYPYLIYLPIDEISMNLISDFYNKQQAKYRNM